MEQDISKKLEDTIEEQGKKIDAIYISVEKTRKYFLTILWVTALSIIVPLVGLMVVIPSFLNTYVQSLNG